MTVPASRAPHTGWGSRLAKIAMAGLLLEAATGLWITFGPFHPSVQWSVLVHTMVGLFVLVPTLLYCAKHWLEYRTYAASHVVVLGYVSLAALLLCLGSGLLVTWQGLFTVRMSGFWRQVHLVTTWVTVATLVPHLGFALVRVCREGGARPVMRYLAVTWGATLAGVGLVAALTWLYSGRTYVNQFPRDYSFLFGTNRPFAPSLARTDTGGAFDPRSLAGSMSCGTKGCHEQITDEWKPSAHRYAAMDTVFQGIQTVMAQQNGPESTRYCGGCHDPISLFSGSKNIFSPELTGSHGYNEGVSCLACHAIRETDVKGNANYTVTQPHEYLWQWNSEGLARWVRDFLIRTYPDEHNKLSKRMFKKPEYCAACHKQFIDQEVNRVGWVQLQNQYDNWAASHWNQKADPRKTVECRECHMPLVDSTDPAAGDAADYNRHPGDRKHRSHRFIASNQLMPVALRLEGWEEQVRLTEQWLQGKFEIPEIKEKWAVGPIVAVSVQAPESIAPGENLPVRVVMTSNKVGHDYPTGPLDIIQSWLEVRVTDAQGQVVYRSGERGTNNFIEPGTFLFKAEPVDQHGNLIDRHNLWEMVGVRYRRALFPGYSDSVQYQVPCPSSLALQSTNRAGPWEHAEQLNLPAPNARGPLTVSAALQYRKVDQFLLNYLFGATNQLTSPVTEIARGTATVQLKPRAHSAAPAAAAREGLAVTPPANP